MRFVTIAGGGALTLLAVGLVGVAMVPVGRFRSTLENRLSAKYGAPVRIDAVERDGWFSFAPIVSIRGLTIRQPAWVGAGAGAGAGDFVRVDRASLRVPVLAALTGRFSPDRIVVDGVRIALVRDATGRSNWHPDRSKDDDDDDTGAPLSDLTVGNSRFTLADARRGLTLAGPIAVDARHGFRIDGRGTFRGTPATIAVRGGRVTGVDPDAAYPFTVDLVSPALALHAVGKMDGVLNTRKFAGDIRVRAPTLKNLDHVIEAGLFGSQPIDFAGHIRHVGRDWFVDRLDARMGRSLFTASASIVKGAGRTMIDGRIHASQFDFDDLSDTRGLAEGAAREARIGPRIVPATRIDLSKIVRTDGRLAFVADRLLARKGSVFRSLRGNLALDDRLLTVSNVVATLQSGRMTGTVKVDSRRPRPKLAIDMHFDGASLATIIGKPDIITGAVRGRISLSGRGDTVREALAHGDGKVAMVATVGSVKTVVADVLGQDLGRAVGHLIHQKNDHVPLRCLIADFEGTGGVFVARPIAIDAGNSVGRGTGRVVVDGERISLTLAGATRNGSAFKIADPIRIGGTMSQPSITIAGMGTSAGKPDAGSALKVIGRSIGSALGIGRKAPKMAPLPDPLDCGPMIRAALQ